MALVSTLAMWLGKNDGKILIQWFGWEIKSTPAFFLLMLSSLVFFLYLTFILILYIISYPKNTLRKYEKFKLNKAKESLHAGIIASYYGNKTEVFSGLNKSKKYFQNTPLLLLLELQSSIFQNNDKASFLILTKMLEINILKPIAIKGLISYSIRKKDFQLFKNVLAKSIDKKFHFSWIKNEIFRFCIENNSWKVLADYLENKSLSNKKENKLIISSVFFQVATDYYKKKSLVESKKFLNKALKLNKFFPPYIELYCQLEAGKNKNELIKTLKSYWIKNPNPNIEDCINLAFSKENNNSKLKILTKILNNHNDNYYKYLILGKFKYYAKVWGASRVALEKSLSFEPSKEAYYYLHKIHETITKDTISSIKCLKLYESSEEKFFWNCAICSKSFFKWKTFCPSCKNFNSIKASSSKININSEKQIVSLDKALLNKF